MHSVSRCVYRHRSLLERKYAARRMILPVLTRYINVPVEIAWKKINLIKDLYLTRVLIVLS